MKTIFPEDKGYKGFFLVGFRKDPDNPAITQRTGTVILKRTFDIDLVAGVLIPSAETLPVFIRDQPENFVINSDFNSSDEESGSLYFWQPEQVTISKRGDQDAQVTGTANGRVVQTLKFKEPLGGRRFWLSFSAKRADNTTARIENVQLESNGHIICAISGNLTDTIKRFSASGIWPADLPTTEMKVVLRMATNSLRTVFYNNIQVEEREHLTVWDPNPTVHYENDLAAFKPEGDVIVLGFTDVAGLCRVKVDGVTWLQRNVEFNGAREKSMFGWEPRIARINENEDLRHLRQIKMGKYSTEPSDYPLEWPFTDPARDPLPGGPGDPRVDPEHPPFENIFCNGYFRTASRLSIMPYLPASAQILIERDNGSDCGFKLPGDTLSANCYNYKGTGPDKENNWQSRSVTMNLDTLVIEPERNRCYIVWRGVWPFDEHYEGDYRRLEVKSVFQ